MFEFQNKIKSRHSSLICIQGNMFKTLVTLPTAKKSTFWEMTVLNDKLRIVVDGRLSLFDKLIFKLIIVTVTITIYFSQEQLDQKLEQRQARETGICQVRRELYAQCFDEVIRQCTINCVERGLLLLRVRDELRMTLHSYQTLYESSIAFGIRKALQAEQVNLNIFLSFGVFVTIR